MAHSVSSNSKLTMIPRKRAAAAPIKQCQGVYISLETARETKGVNNRRKEEERKNKGGKGVEGKESKENKRERDSSRFLSGRKTS